MKTLTLFIAAALSTYAVDVEQFKPHDFSFTAQVSGNPFAAELTGVFTGPNNQVLRIPGFHDGGNAFKIRFAAPAAGTWTMRTESAIPALNAKSESINARANPNPRVHGVLEIDREHPYHFRFPDGARFFLMGYEADWLWGADMLDPQRKLMHRLIDQIDARGFNYVLVNVYAHDTRWCKGKAHELDFGPPALYAFGGSNEKPDHGVMNPRFFQIYDGMMNALLEKGIVAHMMIKVYNKDVNWPKPGSEEEARFFHYVTARYQAYPNIVWDFAKEAYNEKNEVLQKNLTDLVRNLDAYKHLVAVHDDDAYEWDASLNANIDFRTDQQHSDWEQMIAFDRAHRRRPVVNVEFSYELGVEPLPTHTNVNQVDWMEMLKRAYRILMAGGYVAYYYNNTAWDIVKPDPEPPGQARWQILKQTFESIPYWRMDPVPNLAVGGTCLAEAASTWICYLEGAKTRRKENNITLNLTSLSGKANAEWINTWTGARKAAGEVSGGIKTFDYPEDFNRAPALLILRRP
jgi:hypothetical protein